MLQNQFHLAATEPIDGHAASPGQVANSPVADGGGINVGYTITAFGRLETIITIATH